jgi:hypothetical protein
VVLNHDHKVLQLQVPRNEANDAAFFGRLAELAHKIGAAISDHIGGQYLSDHGLKSVVGIVAEIGDLVKEVPVEVLLGEHGGCWVPEHGCLPNNYDKLPALYFYN